MPELPEVETVRLGLQKYLVGHKIEDVEIITPKIFTGNPKNIIGAKVKRVTRFAKVLSVDLSNGYSIIIHIKMTGQLIYRGPNLPHPPRISKKVPGIGGKHTHAIFHLNGHGALYYNDVRKFGWIKILKSEEVRTSEFIGKLGPEPFKDLTRERFKNIVKKFKTPVKPLLMDQERIAGVGNIYANDACFLSKIHPKRPSCSLSNSELNNLYNALIQVLKEGLKRGGTSEFSYVQSDGSEGSYQKYFLVYRQDGKLCNSCKKEKIRRITLSGRGTFFCPKCQI